MGRPSETGLFITLRLYETIYEPHPLWNGIGGPVIRL